MLRAVGKALGSSHCCTAAPDKIPFCLGQLQDPHPALERFIPSSFLEGKTSAFEVTCPQLAELTDAAASVIYQSGEQGEEGSSINLSLTLFFYLRLYVFKGKMLTTCLLTKSLLSQCQEFAQTW